MKMEFIIGISRQEQLLVNHHVLIKMIYLKKFDIDEINKSIENQVDSGTSSKIIGSLVSSTSSSSASTYNNKNDVDDDEDEDENDDENNETDNSNKEELRLKKKIYLIQNQTYVIFHRRPRHQRHHRLHLQHTLRHHQPKMQHQYNNKQLNR